MNESRQETPTLRLRRLDDAALELAEVLREGRITTLFQPLVDPQTRAVFAFEALSRGPSGSWLHSPQNLFQAADRCGCRVDLEFRCIELALKRFMNSRVLGRLFLNVAPDTVYQETQFAGRFKSLLQAIDLPPDRCVIELTEEGLVDDYARLRATLQPLRDLGCELAIDDLGAGSSGLRTWSELRPEFVKIDRYFITGIDSDATKLEFVRSIIDMGHALGSRVIAEGVETQGECRELVALGADRLQGYLFGRPEPVPISMLPQIDSIERRVASEIALCAEHLVNEVPPVPPDMRVADVVELFRQRTDHDAVAVVADGRPQGIVRRDELFALISKPLHPEIYNKRPISSVMESPTLLVDCRLRLEQVSRLVTQSGRRKVREEFVITRDGRYLGLGQTIDLLRRITEQQVLAAKHSNPLTLLPGNNPVRENIDRLIVDGVHFVVCYVDMDAFKPYNDCYGYAQGDQVILHLAALLKSAVAPPLDFVGHVGGDDFIAVMRSEDWRERIVTVLENFAATIAVFYSVEDADAGCIRVADRDGKPRDFPLISLSVAALDSGTRGFVTAEAAAQLLAQVKKMAKEKDGNSFLYRKGDRVGTLLPYGSAVRDVQFAAGAGTQAVTAD
jgi:diguanylate cyclase (GGDEF)-like protein